MLATKNSQHARFLNAAKAVKADVLDRVFGKLDPKREPDAGETGEVKETPTDGD